MKQSSEKRLKTLQEVLDAVMQGEDVDVKQKLGTGKEQDEKAWEEGEKNNLKDSEISVLPRTIIPFTLAV